VLCAAIFYCPIEDKKADTIPRHPIIEKFLQSDGKSMASKVTELKTTMYTTPVISSLLRYLSLFIIRSIGWRIVGKKPDDAKYIVVAAPHTSNWDFILYVLLAFILRFDSHWMGKDALFFFPFKRLMVWLGGIPIDRSKTNNVVSQMVDYYASVEELVVIIPPEGTRSKAERWKTGFYHIADQAKLPLVLGYIDARTKTIGFGPHFIPTGDLDADMQAIQAFYADKQGINPENF
jgi:1-acyl-sn-glycerol-3-phosphate acyltransferase